MVSSIFHVDVFHHDPEDNTALSTINPALSSLSPDFLARHPPHRPNRPASLERRRPGYGSGNAARSEAAVLRSRQELTCSAGRDGSRADAAHCPAASSASSQPIETALNSGLVTASVRAYPFLCRKAE